MAGVFRRCCFPVSCRIAGLVPGFGRVLAWWDGTTRRERGVFTCPTGAICLPPQATSPNRPLPAHPPGFPWRRARAASRTSPCSWACPGSPRSPGSPARRKPSASRARCAVLVECRAAALAEADPETTGVRGGLTPEERRAVARRRRRRGGLRAK
ncbi:WhiB family transcriptional regulator [Yinghuangia aomiensis]